MLHRTHILSETKPKGSSEPAQHRGLSALLDLPPDPGAKAREYRQISALLALCQSHIKPYLTELPSPSAPTSPGPQRDAAAPRKGRKRLGIRRGTRRARLRRSPEAPRAAQHPAESAQFSAPWTVSPLHCPLSEPRRSAARSPGPGQAARSGPPGRCRQRGLNIYSSAEQLEVRKSRGMFPITAEGCRQRQGQIITRGPLKLLKNIKKNKRLIQNAARQPIRAHVFNHMSEFSQ